MLDSILLWLVPISLLMLIVYFGTRTRYRNIEWDNYAVFMLTPTFVTAILIVVACFFAGHCFYEDTGPAFMRGTFYHRENYLKELTDEEVARIPEKQREQLISIGKNTSEIEFSILTKTPLKPDRFYCMRSHIVPMNLPYRLTETQDLVDVLFTEWGDDIVYCKISNPTFDLSKREGV